MSELELILAEKEVLLADCLSLREKLALAEEALEFYANKENWDDDHYCPTIWENGDIDLGNKARAALEKIRGLSEAKSTEGSEK